MILLLAHPPHTFPSTSCLSFSDFLRVSFRAYWRERGGEGGRGAKSYYTKRKLALYKSFNTLWFSSSAPVDSSLFISGPSFPVPHWQCLLLSYLNLMYSDFLPFPMSRNVASPEHRKENHSCSKIVAGEGVWYPYRHNPKPVFVNVKRAQESIQKNRFRQPM